MAIFKIADPGSNQYTENYIADKIAYILRPKAILSGYWGGYGFVKGNIHEVTEQFYIVRNSYHKSNYIPLRHFILSFDPYWEYNITPFQAYHIAKWICKIFAEAQYQVIFSIHEDKNHLHIHILVNTINLTNGVLYNSDQRNFYIIRNHVDFVLHSYRLWYGEHPLTLYPHSH